MVWSNCQSQWFDDGLVGLRISQAPDVGFPTEEGPMSGSRNSVGYRSLTNWESVASVSKLVWSVFFPISLAEIEKKRLGILFQGHPCKRENVQRLISKEFYMLGSSIAKEFKRSPLCLVA
jgi:hypothetical protein